MNIYDGIHLIYFTSSLRLHILLIFTFLLGEFVIPEVRFCWNASDTGMEWPQCMQKCD